MNNVLLKYLCVKDNTMPPQLHQIPSKDTSFFINEILKKFRKKGLYTQEGKFISFTFIFMRVDNVEVKALKKLMRDVRCYFNKLCSENPDKFYMEVPLIDWGKYNYQF